MIGAVRAPPLGGGFTAVIEDGCVHESVGHETDSVAATVFEHIDIRFPHELQPAGVGYEFPGARIGQEGVVYGIHEVSVLEGFEEFKGVTTYAAFAIGDADKLEATGSQVKLAKGGFVHAVTLGIGGFVGGDAHVGVNPEVHDGAVALFEVGQVVELLSAVPGSFAPLGAGAPSPSRHGSAEAVGDDHGDCVCCAGQVVVEAGELGLVGVPFEASTVWGHASAKGEEGRTIVLKDDPRDVGLTIVILLLLLVGEAAAAVGGAQKCEMSF